MKNKVLLIFEDFNEARTLQNVLQRVGFDVVTIGNELAVSDKLLTFNPDVVAVHGHNIKIHPLTLSQKLTQSYKYQGKVVLVFPTKKIPPPQDFVSARVDVVMEAPYIPETMMGVLARLLGLDATLLVQKYRTQSYQTPTEETHGTLVKGFKDDSSDTEIIKISSVPIEDKKRVESYSQYIAGIHFDKTISTHKKKDVTEHFNEVKKDWKKEELEAQDQLRRDFVVALYKKKR